MAALGATRDVRKVKQIFEKTADGKKAMKRILIKNLLNSETAADPSESAGGCAPAAMPRGSRFSK